MISRTGAPAERRWPMAVFGSLLALAGTVALVGVFSIVYGESEQLRAYAIDLGLAGAALVSAVGQVLFLLGAWLVWRSTRSKGR